ncbi:MAG: glycosyltransferase [Ruminococcus sp.]|nr:glycosyltransferase [Ruminococcus sp.]
MSKAEKDIKYPEYSVLMSVYAGEKAEFFEKSIKSILTQTLPTDDFVIVCDGELTGELDGVLEKYCALYPFIRVIRSEKCGVGQCANKGLAECKHEYIVKMDSDDIARSDRCELTMRLFAKHPELDMVGGYLDEFDSDTGEHIAYKKTPITNEEIRKYAKRRNPFNNQTLCYRKSLAKRIGGYTDIPRCEDYEFVVNMLMAGAIGHNIPKVLVDYRVNEGNYKRRSNWVNTKAFFRVRFNNWRKGFSSFADALIPCAFQLFMFIMPAPLTSVLYKKFLRK